MLVRAADSVEYESVLSAAILNVSLAAVFASAEQLLVFEHAVRAVYADARLRRSIDHIGRLVIGET